MRALLGSAWLVCALFWGSAVAGTPVTGSGCAKVAEQAAESVLHPPKRGGQPEITVVDDLPIVVEAGRAPPGAAAKLSLALEETARYLPESSQGPMVRVLDRYKGKNLPVSVTSAENHAAVETRNALTREWGEALGRRGPGGIDIPTRDMVSISKVAEGEASEVYRVVATDGTVRYFRPARGLETLKDPSCARITYSASALSEMLSETAVRAGLPRLGMVPKAEVAQIRVAGQLRVGVLSESAPGVQALKSSTRGSSLNARSVSNAESFEFLIGNGDVHANNYMIHGDQVQVFDHGHSFPSYVTGTSNAQSLPMGFSLPKKYTPEFARAIQDTAFEANLEARLGRSLTQGERDAVLFRRQVILEDIRTKGSSAILTDAEMHGTVFWGRLSEQRRFDQLLPEGH